MPCRMCHNVVQYVGAKISDELSASICRIGKPQKIEAVCSFEMFVFPYPTTRRLLPEKAILNVLSICSLLF
jgi:hypothetical protein